MEPQARYTVVGCVVLGLVGLLVASFVWLNRGKSSDGKRFYLIYFKNTPVNGLQIDSAVTMRGIRVGTVTSSAIAPSDIELVRVLIRVEENTPVKINTRAVIQRNLLTGLANVDLVSGSQNAHSLDEPPLGEPYPVIPEGSTGLQQIQNTMPEVIERANALLNSANTFFNDENRETFSKTLGNVQVLTAQLSKDAGSLHQMIEDLSTLNNDVSTLVRNLDHRTHEVTDSLNASSNVISREITALASDLRRSAQGFSVVLEGFENPRKLITGPSNEALGPGEKKK